MRRATGAADVTLGHGDVLLGATITCLGGFGRTSEHQNADRMMPQNPNQTMTLITL
jgi:hypothetical protein